MINIDFNDVVTVLENKGLAHIGIGKGTGDDKILEAVNKAIENPILENSIEGAGSLLINIAMGGDVPAETFQIIIEEIQKHTAEDVKFKPGVYILDNDEDEIIVTVIAAELKNDRLKKFTKSVPGKGLSGDKDDFLETAQPTPDKESGEKEDELPEEKLTDISEQKDIGHTGRAAENWPFNQSNINEGPFDIPNFLSGKDD
jgi:cell division protein FtsZ